MSSRRERKAAARAVREAAKGPVGSRHWPLALRLAVALAVGIALGFALRVLVESL
jgi:hypothetical protein